MLANMPRGTICIEDIEPTSPKWSAFSSMLPMTCGLINHLWPAVLFFSHPTRSPNAIFDLSVAFGRAFCLLGIRSDRPVEPRSFVFG